MSAVTYTPGLLQEYAGNPLIEALPPMIRSDETLLEAMAIKPLYSNDDKSLAAAIRREMVSRLQDLFIPLPTHFDLLERLSTCVRRSYTWRNPLSPRTQTWLHATEARLTPETLTARASAGSVLFVKGISGIGKSKGIEACLRALGPCVIRHEVYGDVPLLETQIVWLKVSCPEDRSLKSLCMAILAAAQDALGSECTYTADYIDDPRATIGSLARAVMQCLANNHVGVLVVDELQNLFASKGQPAVELLNFLLRIRDESGICLTLCGTYASLQLLQDKFRLGRRLAAGGVMEMLRADNGADQEWVDFCEILWSYQWVTKPMVFDTTVALTFYDLTQAIRGLAVPLFIRAQEDAISSNQESVTCESLRAAWRQHFSMLDAPLAALRSQDANALAQWDDLCDTAALASMAANSLGQRPLPGQIPDGQKRGERVKGSSRGKGKAAPDAELAQLQQDNGLQALRNAGVVGIPEEEVPA